MLSFVSNLITLIALCSCDSYQWYSVINQSSQEVYLEWTGWQGGAVIEQGAVVVPAGGESFIATLYGSSEGAYLSISYEGEVVATALPSTAACAEAETFPLSSGYPGCQYEVNEEGNALLVCETPVDPEPVEPPVCQQDVLITSDTELFWAEGQSTGVQFLAGTTAKLNECFESGWCSIHYAEADYFVPQGSLVSWGC